MNKHSMTLKLAGVLPALTMVVGSPLQAADEPIIEEITVTARKREESLQDVPLSIAAYTSEELSRRNIGSLDDVALFTAGFNYEDYANGAFAAPTIRGLSETNILDLEQNVSTFLGGVYLPRSYMVDAGFFGIDRVEVVRGPQSALYGRNAFAGAVNYVPRRAPKEFSMDAVLGIGTDEYFEAGVSIGGPLGNRVALLVGYSHSEFDGTWSNAHPNASARVSPGADGTLGGWDNDTWFVALDLQLTDNFKAELTHYSFDQLSEPQGQFRLSRNHGDHNCSIVNGVAQFYCGELPHRTSIVDPRSQGLSAESDVSAAELTLDLADDVSVKYLFGRATSEAFSFEQSSVNGITGDTPAGIQFLGLPIGELTAYSHEGRVNFELFGAQVAIGAFYSTVEDDAIILTGFQPVSGTTPIYPETPGFIPVQSNFTEVETKAVFAQFDRTLWRPDFTLSLEGRYTEEFKETTDRTTTPNLVFKDTFYSFTPRAVFKWDYSDQINFYVSAAKGVKSGGFNGGSIMPEERTFDQESNWTYEVGMKSQLGRAQLNIAAFHVDWSDLQMLSTSANPAFLGTITQNVGRARNTGLEIEGIVLLTDTLTANFAASYGDPKFASGVRDARYLTMRDAASQPILICDNIACPSDGSLGGNSLPRQSKVHASAGLLYERNLNWFGGSSLRIGGDVSYKSKQFVENMNLTEIEPRTLVNARIGLSAGAWNAQLWAKNLLDEVYVSNSLFLLAPSNNVRYEGAYGPRRMVGLTVRYRM
ncbi:MAG TPA: TonB-dependent receptor [Steroidobacteraceae bacterium]